MLSFRPFNAEATAPTPSPEDTKKLPPLRYEKLPEGEVFRVLKTIDIDATSTRCTLTTASLKNPPAYVALSYTWGQAVREDEMTAEENKTIICNDSAVSVTENLWNALRVIHSGDGCLWADAICINQDDLDERGSQVKLMGQIYSKAYMVIVWLGLADGAAIFATRIIQDFCKKYRTIGDAVQFMGSNTFWDKMGREPFTNDEANAIAHFYNRLWFERMWVLQEVILATNIRVLCGTLEIEWEDIVTMSTYLFNSGYAHAWHDELRAKPLKNPNVRLLGVAPMQMSKIRKSCIDGIMVDENVIIKLKDLDTVDIEQAFCKFLALMTLVGRSYECGRPADRIFAPLALALHKFSGLIGSSFMVPDYTKSLEQTYTEATAMIIQKTSELVLLTAVEDSA